MDNLSQKEEYKPEDMLLYNTNYNLYQKEEIDDKDSITIQSCDENNDLIQNGRWSTEEHIRFIKGCMLFANNWKKVKKYVRTRSSAQIRSHAQKYLIKLNKKYPSLLQNDLRAKDKGVDNRNNTHIGENYNDSEVIANIINSLNSTNIDMETVEKGLLARFKFNGNDKPFQSIVIDDLNIKSDYSSSNNNNNINESSSNNKDRNKKSNLFSLTKVSKSQREEEIRRLKNNRDYTNCDIDKSDSQGHHSHNKTSGQCSDNKTQDLEEYIHSCLNSYDPIDLTKLLTKFSTNVTSNNSFCNNDSNNTIDTQGNTDFISELLMNKDNTTSRVISANQRDYPYFQSRNTTEAYDTNSNQNNKQPNLFQICSFPERERGEYTITEIQDRRNDNNPSDFPLTEMSHIEERYNMMMANANNDSNVILNNMNMFNARKVADSNSNRNLSIEQRYSHNPSRNNYQYPFHVTNNDNPIHRNNNSDNPNANSSSNNNTMIKHHQSAFTHHSTLTNSANDIFNQILMRQNAANNRNRIFKAYYQ